MPETDCWRNKEREAKRKKEEQLSCHNQMEVEQRSSSSSKGSHMIHNFDSIKDMQGNQVKEDDKVLLLLPSSSSSSGGNHGSLTVEKWEKTKKKKGIRLKWAEGIIDNQNKESFKSNHLYMMYYTLSSILLTRVIAVIWDRVL